MLLLMKMTVTMMVIGMGMMIGLMTMMMGTMRGLVATFLYHSAPVPLPPLRPLGHGGDFLAPVTTEQFNSEQNLHEKGRNGT